MAIRITRSGCERKLVRVDRDSSAAIPHRRPFLKDSFRGELTRPQFLIVPEKIALGTILFSEQPIDQANGLHRFAVINRANFEAGLLLEFFQNRFGIDLVLGSVHDDLKAIERWVELDNYGQQTPS